MKLDTRNATLEDLASILRDQQGRKHDVVVPATAIRSSGGNLIIAGAGSPVPHPTLGMVGGPGTFRPTVVADEGIAEKLGVPVGYLKRLRVERPDLYDANVNGWLHGCQIPKPHQVGEEWEMQAPPDGRTFLVRCFKGDTDDDGVARALLSDTYKPIDNLDVLTAALEGIYATNTHVQVIGCDLSDRRMYVKVMAPEVVAMAPKLLEGYRSPFDGPGGVARIGGGGWTLERARAAAAAEGKGYEPGKEPVVFGGFVISNSEVGGGAMTITPRIEFEICGNGLTLTVDALRSIHLGSKLDEGVIRWSDDTQHRNLELITAKARDAVATFLDPEYVAKVLARLEEKAATPLTNPAEQVRVVGKQLGFSQERTDAVLDLFIRGGQVTAGGLLNAVTAYAQTVEDADQANDLEGMGVRALELAAAL